MIPAFRYLIFANFSLVFVSSLSRDPSISTLFCHNHKLFSTQTIVVHYYVITGERNTTPTTSISPPNMRAMFCGLLCNKGRCTFDGRLQMKLKRGRNFKIFTISSFYAPLTLLIVVYIVTSTIT